MLEADRHRAGRRTDSETGRDIQTDRQIADRLTLRQTDMQTDRKIAER